MAVSILEDPIKAVKDRIESQWDNTNTSIGADPHIGYGWFDKRNEEPQITVWPRRDSRASPGYSYMTGSGPGIDRDSDVEIHLWTGRNQSPSNTSDTLNDLQVNPRTLAHEMGEEIDRIIITSPLVLTDQEWATPGDLTMVPEPDDQSPVQWHYTKVVTTRQSKDPL